MKKFKRELLSISIVEGIMISASIYNENMALLAVTLGVALFYIVLLAAIAE